ncbi:MAG TPA: sigma-70 family RNA polymerase sigma factor [Acidimicrobiales bacterium]|nr:sigma-70 family RNA polymerase sigma factor [Acidimicrobiales bacterium]
MSPEETWTSDEELLERAGTDPAAFEAFYRRHVGLITRFLAQRCRTPEDLADATSATFLAVLVSSQTFDPTIGPAAKWLRSIAANEARRLSRSHVRRTALAERVRGSRLLTPDDTERLGEMIDAAERAAALAPEIRRAPEGEREVLRVMAFGGVGPAEAAAELGISPGAARVRLSRLRKRLAETNAGESHLGTYAIEEGR